MALLVKERKALEKLEQSFYSYFITVVGEEIEIDPNLSVEERLLYLTVLLDGSY